jgi:hypothetical protein
LSGAIPRGNAFCVDTRAATSRPHGKSPTTRWQTADNSTPTCPSTNGSPKPAPPRLLEAAAEPAMIAVGSRGQGGFTGLLLGSTSHAVLHHATCPVAVFPPTDRDLGRTATRDQLQQPGAVADRRRDRPQNGDAGSTRDG